MTSSIPIRLTAVLLVVIACEVIARIGLGLIDARIQEDWRFQVVDYEDLVSDKEDMIEKILATDTSGYISLDADLGWSINPNRREPLIWDGKEVAVYESNSEGIRSSREYGFEPEADMVRIAVFGDSFSHADDIYNSEAWTSVWEQSQPNVEVLNFGVPGYGTDQAWLRYKRDGVKFSPDIVVLGVMSENLNRNLNTFVPFYRYDAWPNSKPRFVFTDEGSLELIDNEFRTRSDFRVLIDDLPATLRKLGEHDWWYNAKYRPGVLDSSAIYRVLHYGYILLRYPWLLDSEGLYNKRSEHYRILLGIIRRFAEEARGNGSVPVVALIPSLYVLARHRESGILMYSPLVEDLDRMTIQYVDFLEGFTKYGKDLHDPEIIPRHYSARGNQIAARYIEEELRILVEDILLEKQNQ